MPLRSLTLVAGLLLWSVASAQEPYYNATGSMDQGYVDPSYGDPNMGNQYVGDYSEPAAMMPPGMDGYNQAMPAYGGPMMGDASGGGYPVPQNLPPIPESWLNSMWDPVPCIEVSGEAMFAQPNMPGSVPLANQVLFPSGLGGINTKFNQPWITGAKITGEAHLDPLWSVLGSGFIVDGPNRSGIPLGVQDLTYFVASDAGLGLGPLSNLPAGFPTEADAVSMDWDFETYGADINVLMHYIPLKGPINDVAFGGGCRYLSVQDRVGLNFVDELNSLSGSLHAKTSNEMIGPQFYSRFRFMTPSKRIRCSWETKIALAANFADDYTAVGSNGYANVRSTTQFTPIVEGNALVEFFVVNHVTLYAGFFMLWADEVDRAANLFTSDINEFGNGNKHTGDLWMFGPRVGGTFSY